MTMRALSLGVLLLAACRLSGTEEPSSGTQASTTSDRVTKAEVAPGERLLYLPEGDPRSLLGREVTRDAEGHLRIAAERRPGCTAAITAVDNAFSRHYESELRDVAGFDADIRRIAQLEGHFERGLALHLSIDNQQVLRGDLEGDCGEQVITEVKVGRGSREVVVGQQSGGSVAVNLGAVGSLGGGGQRGTAEREALSWDTPQAWAFKLSPGQVGRADLEIHMPEILAADERVQPRVRVNTPLWLIVLFRDADGHHGVLLPRGHSSAIVAAGAELRLPEMIPSNLPGHDEDRETLLVFGFTEEEDFKLFKPPAGAVDSERADEYAERMRQRLADGEIPRSRWSTAEFTYVIRAGHPAGPAPP